MAGRRRENLLPFFREINLSQKPPSKHAPYRIGQNSVPWPCLVARAARKLSSIFRLYRKRKARKKRLTIARDWVCDQHYLPHYSFMKSGNHKYGDTGDDGEEGEK